MTEPTMSCAAPDITRRAGWEARLPFYYGWAMVGLAAVAMSATLPGRTYGLGLIKEPLRGSLGIGDLRFNVLNFWAIILGAAVVMPVGRLIDRLGVRWTLVGVSAALGASVLLMSRARDETTLFVTLTLVRGLGQGALSVVAIALVGKWFKRRVGPAMGAFTLLLAVGFVAPIFAVGAAVQAQGWREAWAWVGYSLLLGLAPLGWLIARDTPESCGVVPDDPRADEAAPAASVPLATALRTPAFWAYTLAATLFNFTFSALTLDSEALLTEHGLDGEKVNQAVLGVLMVSGLPANIAAGWLARSRPMGKLLAAGVALLAASLAVFPLTMSVGVAMGYAALLGVSGGIITVIYFAVYGHTYGQAHIGSIQSAVQVLSVFASATGPVALAACRQGTGSTDLFFYVFAGAAALLAVLAWVVRPPLVVTGPSGPVGEGEQKAPVSSTGIQKATDAARSPTPSPVEWIQPEGGVPGGTETIIPKSKP
jgi:MFS family permease